ncbi:hypothetical protein [Chryseobacterium aureum]|uniref:hypothetical protein n=1 Tax=Chryseobacterium aureum TaxID=2497456 RepID=UPI000F86B9C7|nr:hypothetical protein [Chryseobacterium aureum]
MGTLELQNPELGTEGIGNKLANLITKNKDRTNPLIAAGYMDHDIGIMFMFQAKKGVLNNSGAASKLVNPYLKSYSVDISTFEALYNTFSTRGNEVRFDFVFITQKDYTKYTGNINVSTGANEFLYFIATPMDYNGDPLGHYIIFNLGHKFEIDKDFISLDEARAMYNQYISSEFYHKMNTYSNPLQQTWCIGYTWADINRILNERNIAGRLYKEVKFIPGEVIELEIIEDYFHDNPDYDFDATAYSAAYRGNEKRLTLIGRYLPDDLIGKEGFFDMGSLYP